MKESEKELFEKMLEASFKKKKAMESGTRVIAIVNSAKKDFVFVTTKEGKLPGIISSEEFIESELPKQGDEIEAYFLKEDHGDIHFTTCLSGDSLNKDLLEIAKRAEIPVLGQFIGENDSGAEVKIGEFTAFCPFSQIDPEFKKSGLSGKRSKFLIQDIGTRGKFVVSQKKISDKAKEAKLGILKQELKEGMFVTCKVKTIQNFGLIVEMDGGLTALIPISEATYKKNPELEKEFQVGQTLRARILRIDWENQKFALTVKDFLKDPWAQTVPFKEGDIVKGTIDSLKPFGLFVKLDDHFNGLVPTRETGTPNRVPLIQSFKPGEVIDVFVMEVNPERKQISLSIQKAKEIQERMDYSSYLSSDTSGSTSSFGAILQNSLNKNKKDDSMPLHIGLYRPEIPPNTGNIARLCVALGAELHIIGQASFDLSEKAARRAGLDYWDKVRISFHSSLEEYKAILPSGTDPYLISVYGKRSYTDVRYKEGDAFLFGNETSGVPTEMKNSWNEKRILKIPMEDSSRCLNLSNSVAVISYEAMRQIRSW